MRPGCRGSPGGPSQCARKCAREDVRIGCDMLRTFRLARAGRSGGGTARGRAQELVGSTVGDRSGPGKNMNSPILQETVGQFAGSAGCAMRFYCAVVLSAALVIVAADPALARAKSKSKPQCADRPQEFSWNF